MCKILMAGWVSILFFSAVPVSAQVSNPDTVLLRLNAERLTEDTTVRLATPQNDVIGWDILLSIPDAARNDFDLAVYLEDPSLDPYARTACFRDGIGDFEHCRVFLEHAGQEMWLTVISIDAAAPGEAVLSARPLRGRRIGYTQFTTDDAQWVPLDTAITRELRYDQANPDTLGGMIFAVPRSEEAGQRDSIYLNIFARDHDVAATATLLDSAGIPTPIRVSGAALQLRLPMNADASRYIRLEAPLARAGSRTRLAYQVELTTEPLPTPVTLTAAPVVLRGVGSKDYLVLLPTGWSATAVLEGGANLVVDWGGQSKESVMDAMGTQAIAVLGQPVPGSERLLQSVSSAQDTQLGIVTEPGRQWKLTISGSEGPSDTRIMFSRDDIYPLRSLLYPIPDVLPASGDRVYWVSRAVAATDLAWDVETDRDAGLPPLVARASSDPSVELVIADQWGVVRSRGLDQVSWRWRMGEQGIYLIVRGPDGNVTTEDGVQFTLEFWPVKR